MMCWNLKRSPLLSRGESGGVEDCEATRWLQGVIFCLGLLEQWVGLKRAEGLRCSRATTERQVEDGFHG